ncbi:LysM domain-containing protein [Motilibacter rhizosphaerae]|uniref:LysM domain-containing protein n=1 Tax=Motilibacter rhizosphaerae TaxID=598652 RepID=A0A4Q7NQN1_9ACTN|nr:LysM peptidoglycan-binding domain-containing protein [Motilibacter rhizosphaerae]RZS86900.1 LysM domain-containing protein [Motilibacter rhizosphaerae]
MSTITAERHLVLVAPVARDPRARQRPAAPAGPAARPTRLTRRGRLVVLLVALAVLVVGLAVGAQAVGASSSGGPATQWVAVQPGDTLWSIAERAEPGRDTRDAVATLVRLNGLHDSALAPGQLLAVPASR